MSIEPSGAPLSPVFQADPPAPSLIRSEEIKAILYLGLRGDITLPPPKEGRVNILA